MNESPILAPSMISADWWRISEVVRELESAGCQWLHFDAMDGHFVPNFTLGPMFLAAVREHSTLHFDAHLMIENPGNFIDEFLEAGANSISVHVEGNPHLHRLITRIQDGGALAGVVINPSTPVNTLDVILNSVDFVLVMSVNPGFSGQKFLPLALPKIERLAELRRSRGLNFKIQVDGGITPQHAFDAVRLGADVLVSAGSVFVKDQPLSQTVGALLEAMQNGAQARSAS